MHSQLMPQPAQIGAPIPGLASPAFQVRLARPDELESVFKLRYDVFYTEMGAEDSVSTRQGLDVDAFDELCDHLVVTTHGRIIGTYRLLPIRRVLRLGLDPYSESEFSLAGLRSDYADNILELGRSCVHPDFRTGTVPKLLWAGIAQYMLSQDVQALIGCVSVHGISDLQALRLRDALKAKGHWSASYDAKVKPAFAISQEAHEAFEDHIAMVPTDPFLLMPPLMKGYFNLGAKIAGGPAHDAPFHCHDYLVLLDRGHISPRYFNALVKPLLEKNIMSLDR